MAAAGRQVLRPLATARVVQCRDYANAPAPPDELHGRLVRIVKAVHHSARKYCVALVDGSSFRGERCFELPAVHLRLQAA